MLSVFIGLFICALCFYWLLYLSENIKIWMKSDEACQFATTAPMVAFSLFTMSVKRQNKYVPTEHMALPTSESQLKTWDWLYSCRSKGTILECTDRVFCFVLFCFVNLWVHHCTKNGGRQRVKTRVQNRIYSFHFSVGIFYMRWKPM